MSFAEHRHDGFFVLRSPLLPFENLLRWAGEWPEASSLSTEDVAAAYESRLTHARQYLASSVDDPICKEACFVASPSLMGSIGTWRRDPASDRGQRVERSLTKYLLRMSSRCTPFGLFAGWSLGRIADRTELVVGTTFECTRHTRLDHEYLAELVEAMRQDHSVRDQLTYFPNRSLYRLGSRMRYVEVRTQKRHRHHFLMAVEPDDELEHVLTAAANGARAGELASRLEAEGFPIEDSREYVEDLIRTGILSPELDPIVTGVEAIDELVERLAPVPAATSIHTTLDWTRERLHQLDRDGLGASASRYDEIAERLRALPTEVDLARLFQVDMMKPAPRLELDAIVLTELAAAVDVLHVLFAERRDPFEQFRKSFEERYGDAEAPLVEALDEENGIGFGGAASEVTPLLDGIPMGGQAAESTVPFGRRQQLLQGKLFAALQTGAREMVLTAAEIEPLRNLAARAPLPDSVHVMASLIRERPDDSDGPLAVFGGVGGPSGGRMLGRFCHSSAELRDRLCEHLRAEEARRPDAVFVEIAHLPEGRIGNILARPLLREYELAFLGRSGAPPDRVVSIDDLTVSVSEGRVVLRSRRLGREVIPRLCTAHNTSLRTIGLYRFLTALQTQGVVGGLGWDWGAARGAPYLPRVRYQRTILSLQTWNIPNDQMPKPWSADEGSEPYRKFLTWAHERGLPRFFHLADGDNLLLVDQWNPLAVLAFLDEVEERPVTALRELYPAADELACTSEEGSYTHEVVVPFTRRPAEQSNQDAAVPASHRSSERAPRVAFEPGSEWLYLKVYAGPATADRLLREVVAPVVQQSFEERHCDRWFFIRYGDPEHHLRVRFHGAPARLLERVLPMFCERTREALRSGEAWKLVVDTYRPETDRYGGTEALDLCEQAFHADSDAALAISATLEGDEGLDARWRVAARGVQAALDDMGFDLERKLTFLRSTADAQARSLGLNGSARRFVQDKYRLVRKSLEAALGASTPSDPGEAAALRCIAERSTRWKPLLEQLAELEQEGRLTRPLDSLLQSLLHMHVNRVLRGAQRPQEAVIYQFLRNHWESVQAREHARTKRQSAAPEPSRSLSDPVGVPT